MIKLLLTLIMVFTFGTSTVNAEENTTSIEDRISELAEIKSDSHSTIKAKVDELSEDELKTVISNVNELTEPTEDDLAIKEAASSKLKEMKSVVKSLLLGGLTLVMVSGLILMLYEWVKMITGYNDERTYPLILGMILVIVMTLLSKW